MQRLCFAKMSLREDDFLHKLIFGKTCLIDYAYRTIAGKNRPHKTSKGITPFQEETSFFRVR